ncbi:hypothetical protein CL634_04910 [bacterium]|nr:hypothetical protein [bacterium]
MDRTVKLMVSDILHQANDLDCNLSLKRVENEGYIFGNEKKTRVVAVGLLNILNEEDEEEAVIGAFTIDVSKYKWADAEGFSQDQMIDDLRGEIFNLIGVDEVLDYLCHKI